jgi:hypothetical protein
MYSLDIEPNKEEELEKLQQDFERPFCPPCDIEEIITKDHPSLDSGIDGHEWYDSGATIASMADIMKNGIVLRYQLPIKK